MFISYAEVYSENITVRILRYKGNDQHSINKNNTNKIGHLGFIKPGDCLHNLMVITLLKELISIKLEV